MSIVREMLEKATRTGCACDCHDVQPGCMKVVAEEVATFLRAWPSSYEEAGDRFWEEVQVRAGECRVLCLADAVEREAGLMTVPKRGFKGFES
jgi:hypothetical protein